MWLYRDDVMWAISTIHIHNMLLVDTYFNEQIYIYTIYRIRVIRIFFIEVLKFLNIRCIVFLISSRGFDFKSNIQVRIIKLKNLHACSQG